MLKKAERNNTSQSLSLIAKGIVSKLPKTLRDSPVLKSPQRIV